MVHCAPAHAGDAHTFTVKARDEAGNVSAASNAVTVTLLPSTDTEPPSVPTNLTSGTRPNCAFIDRGEVFETSFGRHTFHIRAVDRSGNMGPPSNEITLDSGLSC